MTHTVTQRRRRGFTLVELLVVIGIIALLISILLPSLSRARQAANLIDCQSRLRQMGQAMQLYAVENDGYLPYAEINHGATHILAEQPNRLDDLGHNEQYWKWHYSLSEALGYPVIDQNGWASIHPIFADKDAIEGQEWGWLTHYTTNPRVFTVVGEDQAPVVFGGGDPIPVESVQPKNISAIKNSAEVMAIWDGPQAMDYGLNAIPSAMSMDGWMYSAWGHSFYLNTPHTWVTYDRAIPPGGNDGGNIDGRALQATRNHDVEAAWAWDTHLRFRHMNNTTLAGLFLDGHAEIRKVGEVMVRDIVTNYTSH